MRLSIIGTGYVGLVTGACFAEVGNTVHCVDRDKKKIKDLNKGITPIYEPGLENLVTKNLKRGNLFFSTDISKVIKQTDLCLIAVGTPMGEDGSANLDHVLDVARMIGRNMIHELIIVDKSTVPVGTAQKVKRIISQELAKRKLDINFHVVSNPEFLKEGSAVEDFMKPDRVIIGTDNAKILETIKELYAPFTFSRERFIEMDIKSAELTKYAANALLATKISFMNEMANISERVGADINKVRIALGSDHRIGYSFIYPGCGFGGSCFPKDLRALIQTAKAFDYQPQILIAVEAVNKYQKKAIVEKIIKRFGMDLSDKTFALWGLAFKPETDDMREASSITIIEELTGQGAKIQVYDPRAVNQAKRLYLKHIKGLKYENSKYAVLRNADALVLVTEWKEFRSPDFFEMKKQLKNPIIFDGRNQYQAKKLLKLGFEYYQIGVADNK